MVLSENIEKYNFKAGDRLFLDTNVWLFLNCPTNQQKKEDEIKVNKYSSAFVRALEAKSSIYINIPVISEFINAYARRRWKERMAKKTRESKETNEKNFPFKRFRESERFKETGKDIKDSVHKRVLAHCSLINDRLEESDVIQLVDEYAQGKIDFTDQIILKTCKDENLKLITDDRDFAGQGIPLLTANQRLLN